MTSHARLEHFDWSILGKSFWVEYILGGGKLSVSLIGSMHPQIY